MCVCLGPSTDHAVHIITHAFSTAAESDVSGKRTAQRGKKKKSPDKHSSVHGHTPEHFQPTVLTLSSFLEPGFLLFATSVTQFAGFSGISLRLERHSWISSSSEY